MSSSRSPEDLHVAGGGHAAAVAGGSHKVDFVRHVDRAAEIGHEHEGAAQQPDQHHIAAAVAVIFGDLAAKFGDTGLNFLLGNHYVYSVFHSIQVSCRKKGAEFSIGRYDLPLSRTGEFSLLRVFLTSVQDTHYFNMCSQHAVNHNVIRMNNHFTSPVHPAWPE